MGIRFLVQADKKEVEKSYSTASLEAGKDTV
jgi:hypothetical protein